MSKKLFFKNYRRLLAQQLYWASNLKRLDSFMTKVKETLDGVHDEWNWTLCQCKGTASWSALRSIQWKGRVTLKKLRAMPDE